MWLAASPAPAETVSLATNHAPTKTIFISQNASASLQASANTLADYLGQISGGTYAVSTFNPSNGPDPGIILGLNTDLNFTDEVPDSIGNLKIRERFVIGTANSSQYVFLVGATDLAVQDAVFHWLEKLGCRWFFGSPNWTIVPSDANLAWAPSIPLRSASTTMGTRSISMNIYNDETPAYKMRSIWPEYLGSSGASGDWLQQQLDWTEWSRANRAVSSYYINAGHSYDAVISWARAQGLWSDDYYALINGVRDTTGQLSLGHIEVQNLLRDYVADKLLGSLDSISLEPRDGSKWGTDPLDEAIQPLASGSVTDRVITANNYAAAGVPPGKYIGMYAYNMHSAPPSMNVNDKIYVLIATAFLSQGHTIHSLLAGWSAKAQNLGIRDYFSVWDWDFNLPGGARVSNLSKLKSNIAYYHTNNADIYSAESTDAWGPLGLGFYLSAKLLWNPAADTEALKTDFLDSSFGPAAETMRLFYDHIDQGNRYPLGNDLMGQLYGYIDTARGKTPDAEIVSRLNDLTLYLRYVELVRQYGTSSEEVLRYTWQIKDTNVVSSLACWRKFSGTWPSGMNWQVKYPIHPWKVSHTFTQAEIDQMIQSGIANNPTLPVEPRSYDGDLLLTDAMGATRGGIPPWRVSMWYFLKTDGNGNLPTLTMASGYAYSDHGDLNWTLYTEDGETLLESGAIPPDKVTRTVDFAPQEADTVYLLTCTDNKSTSRVNWTPGSVVTFSAGIGPSLWLDGRASRMYFYVPKGTTFVEASANYVSNCTFYNAAGTTKFVIASDQENIDIVVPVDAGDDDQMWYVTTLKTRGFQFRNIPGLFALNADELLVPRDAYSHLVPSGQTAETMGGPGGLRFVNNFYLHTRTDGTLPPLTVTNGLIYANRGDLDWTLYREDGTTVLGTGTVPPDQLAHTVLFATPDRPGAYRVEMDDYAAGYNISWTAGALVSMSVSQDNPLTNRTRSGRLYFYVPRGTQLVTFAAGACSDLQFYDGDGSLVYSFPGGASGSVTVPSSQAGRIWYFTAAKTTDFCFLNIPGIVARNKDELLVPRWTRLP